MNIIITVNSYYPSKDGVQAVTEYHAEGLVKRGHDVTVVTKKLKNEPTIEIHNGVKIIRFDILTRHTVHCGDKKAYQKLILDLTKESDVMINVCTQIGTTDWVFSILKNIECKKILYMHGMMDFKWRKNNLCSISSFLSKLWNNLRWKLYYKLSIKYFKQYNGIIHLHEFDEAYKFFNERKIPGNIVIENAAEDEFFVGTKNIFEKKHKYIVCVANYIELKNQKLCLEAFYKSDDLGYKLIFIGSEKTRYYKELIKNNEILASKYGERKVDFLVGINRSEIYEYVKNAKLYLFGSTVEKFPVSIVESMAAGVPFISTDVGCVKFLPGGVIIKNSNEMAYWINKLIKDKTLAKNIGDCGNQYAMKNLSIESKVNQLENYIKDL